ncbi:hypothetical protein NT95_01180 [Oenococcus kitaharae]|nr:hypothetical protein NT95_01180 [Oenococcus kitaharae]OEY85002.1 hypothetical protein NT96_02750 [Oenococcus kitaharae]OEY85792.1 hypothetical protein NV75_03055 [Oenococcus kitaharae]
MISACKSLISSVLLMIFVLLFFWGNQLPIEDILWIIKIILPFFASCSGFQSAAIVYIKMKKIYPIDG